MLLLDSDIMVDVLRRYAPAIAWLNSLSDQVAVPGYVAMELFQGCRNKSEQERVQKVLRDFVIVWPLPDACDQALSAFASASLSHNFRFEDRSTLPERTVDNLANPVCRAQTAY